MHQQQCLAMARSNSFTMPPHKHASSFGSTQKWLGSAQDPQAQTRKFKMEGLPGMEETKGWRTKQFLQSRMEEAMVLTGGKLQTQPVQDEDKMHIRILERQAHPRDNAKQNQARGILHLPKEQPVINETVLLQTLRKAMPKGEVLEYPGVNDIHNTISVKNDSAIMITRFFKRIHRRVAQDKQFIKNQREKHEAVYDEVEEEDEFKCSLFSSNNIQRFYARNQGIVKKVAKNTVKRPEIILQDYDTNKLTAYFQPKVVPNKEQTNDQGLTIIDAYLRKNSDRAKGEGLLRRLDQHFSTSGEILKERKASKEYKQILESLEEDGYEEDFEEEIDESSRLKGGRTEESVKESLMSIKDSVKESIDEECQQSSVPESLEEDSILKSSHSTRKKKNIKKTVVFDSSIVSSHSKKQGKQSMSIQPVPQAHVQVQYQKEVQSQQQREIQLLTEAQLEEEAREHRKTVEALQELRGIYKKSKEQDIIYEQYNYYKQNDGQLQNMANRLMVEVDKCMFMQNQNVQMSNMQTQVDQLARIQGTSSSRNIQSDPSLHSQLLEMKEQQMVVQNTLVQILNMLTTLKQEQSPNINTTLSPEQVAAIMANVKTNNTLPQAQTNTTLPQAQKNTTQPQAQKNTTQPQAQTNTTQPETQQPVHSPKINEVPLVIPHNTKPSFKPSFKPSLRPPVEAVPSPPQEESKKESASVSYGEDFENDSGKGGTESYSEEIISEKISESLANSEDSSAIMQRRQQEQVKTQQHSVSMMSEDEMDQTALEQDISWVDVTLQDTPQKQQEQEAIPEAILQILWKQIINEGLPTRDTKALQSIEAMLEPKIHIQDQQHEREMEQKRKDQERINKRQEEEEDPMLGGMGSSLFNRSQLEAEIQENIQDYGEQKYIQPEDQGQQESRRQQLIKERQESLQKIEQCLKNYKGGTLHNQIKSQAHKILEQLHNNSYVEQGGQFLRESDIGSGVDPEVLASMNEQLGVQMVVHYNTIHQKRGLHVPTTHNDIEILMNKFPFMVKTAAQKVRELSQQVLRDSDEWLPRYNANKLVTTLWNKPTLEEPPSHLAMSMLQAYRTEVQDHMQERLLQEILKDTVQEIERVTFKTQMNRKNPAY